jgi:hypothetical protein
MKKTQIIKKKQFSHQYYFESKSYSKPDVHLFNSIRKTYFLNLRTHFKPCEHFLTS